MQTNSDFDFVVLLLLVGIYFIFEFFSTKQITDLLYGIILVIYYIKFRFLNKKACK